MMRLHRAIVSKLIRILFLDKLLYHQCDYQSITHVNNFWTDWMSRMLQKSITIVNDTIILRTYVRTNRSKYD